MICYSSNHSLFVGARDVQVQRCCQGHAGTAGGQTSSISRDFDSGSDKSSSLEASGEIRLGE